MGYYIQVPENLNKAKQICDIHGAKVIPCPEKFSDIPDNLGLICVVENGPFDAAGYCFNEREFEDFRAPDMGPRQRRRTWLVLDKELTEKLANYRKRG